MNNELFKLNTDFFQKSQFTVIMFEFCMGTDLVLPEGVNQSTVDVVNGNAEHRQHHILSHSCGEGVLLLCIHDKRAINKW